MSQAATIDVEERRTYIGASEAAAALGFSPWNDPIGLAMEKWGERESKPASFRMKLGLLVEPLIGTLYREETGRKLRAGGSKTRRMKGHPWIGAHPDFYLRTGGVKAEAGLVQAKLSDEFGEGVPFHYRLQGIAELAVTGAPWIDFAVLTGRTFEVHRIEPEPGEVDDLVADLDDYWHGYIVPKLLPPATSGSGEALRARYPSAKLDVGKLANDAQEAKLATYLELARYEKEAKEAKELAGNEIRAMIGDAKWIEGGGVRATWSRWESDDVEWKLVADAFRGALGRVDEQILSDAFGTTNLDDVVGLYTTKKPGHRLTVNMQKEK